MENKELIQKIAEAAYPYFKDEGIGSYEYNESQDNSRLTAENILTLLEPLIPKWVSVEDGLPERLANKSYSQVSCLVKQKGEIRILVFNHEHMCWDQEDGDDYECDINEVDAWQPLPSTTHPFEQLLKSLQDGE